MFLIFLGVCIIAAWAYVLFVRPHLIATYPQFGKFAATEKALFERSRTILMARLYWVGGAIVSLQALAAQAGINFQPVIDELSKLIPEGYRSLAVGLFLAFTGIAIEWLRHATTGPVGSSAEG